MLNHSAAKEETLHLSQTLELIEREIIRLQADTETQAALVKQAKVQSGGVYSSDLAVAQILYDHKRQALHQHRLALHTPYFTRVDFTPARDGCRRTYYIGKWGVSKPETMEPAVIDWRAPAANLYYAGQLGPVEYAAPDGIIEGTLSLKRQLGIRNGVLETIFDTDLALQDAYLMGVLSEVRGERLRDVVSTIQSEQNVIIRHDPMTALVVQGVAGSGKTTIALHRIAYLLYAQRETLLPQHMMILAPNPLFLDYISSVLPDLCVDQVRQTTYVQFIASLLKDRMPPFTEIDRFHETLDMSPSQSLPEENLARFFGSLRFRSILDEYLSFVERSMIPEGGIVFGPALLYSYEQVCDIFLKELAPFPLERRLSELGKYVKQKLQSAQRQAAAWYEAECQKRVERILESMPDSPQRRSRVSRLYDSRDQRLKELSAKAKTFQKDEMARWPRLDVRKCYEAFFTSDWNPSLSSAERPLWNALCERKRQALQKGVYTVEDLGPFTLMVRKLFGLPRNDIRHTVVDEAQDFSPFQFQLLRELVGNDSFTIVGDLMQGIHGWHGLKCWEEILQPVFSGRADLHPLRTSYRSTVEIMQFASRVCRRHPISGAMEARPVLRHGPLPAVQGFEDEESRNAFLLENIRMLQKESFQTIAVIGRNPASCHRIAEALSQALPVHVIQSGDASYRGGVVIIPSSMVKGLEFDCVLLADADEQSFADTDLHAKLLYVCLTRPLHRLYCCYVGRLTPLLEEP